ncbi:MAG: hypothetical protein VYC40_03120 [Pseudomonadota bacterium]|nr:hypothetical protein [Pseudomonadota bacterium]
MRVDAIHHNERAQFNSIQPRTLLSILAMDQDMTAQVYQGLFATTAHIPTEPLKGNIPPLFYACKINAANPLLNRLTSFARLT